MGANTGHDAFLFKRDCLIVKKISAICQYFLGVSIIFLSFAFCADAQDYLSLKWSFNIGRGINTTPAFASDGLIYAGADDGILYGFYSDGSKSIALLSTGGQIVSSPAIGKDGTIFIASKDHYAYSVSTAGKLKWRLSSDNPIIASPAIASDGSVYIASADGYLYALRSEGTLAWRFQSGLPITIDPVVSADGAIYIVSGQILYAIRSSDGLQKWYLDIKANPSSPVLDSDGTVYISADSGYVYGINSTDGKVKTSFKTDTKAALSSPIIGRNSILYVGSADLHLYAFDPENPDDAIWRAETDSAVIASSLLGSDDVIYALSSAGTVYAISSNTGKVLQSLSIGVSAGSLTMGPDGTLYMGTSSGYLAAISTLSQNGPATSAWPMFGHDIRHTHRNGSNLSPTADAGDDRTVTENDRIALDGSGSSDPDFGIFSYYWTQTGGVTVTLENASSIRPEFTAPSIENEEEQLTFQLTVTDSHGLTSTDTCTVTVEKNDHTCFIGTAVSNQKTRQ